MENILLFTAYQIADILYASDNHQLIYKSHSPNSEYVVLSPLTEKFLIIYFLPFDTGLLRLGTGLLLGLYE